MKQFAIILSVLFLMYSANAQTASQFKKQIKKDIKEIQKSKGKKYISDYSYNKYITAVPDAILKKLPEYESDTLINVRRLVYDLYYDIARKNSDNNIRRQAVNHLVTACKDTDFDLRTSTANKLKYFKKDDFSEEAKKQLIEYLSEGKDIFRNTVRLIGFLDMEEQIPKLNELLNDTTIKNPEIFWNIHLTLARLGEENEISYCTNLARSKGVNDRIIHFLLKDLIYTRQKQAFDYLIEILYSEEKNCHPANPHLENAIVCGYRIMELLAPAVKDFPFETWPGTSQLKVKDYDKALEDVRKWFRDNPDYEIKKDAY